MRRLVREDNVAGRITHSPSSGRPAKTNEIIGLKWLKEEEYDKHMVEDGRKQL